MERYIVLRPGNGRNCSTFNSVRIGTRVINPVWVREVPYCCALNVISLSCPDKAFAELNCPGRCDRCSKPCPTHYYCRRGRCFSIQTCRISCPDGFICAFGGCIDKSSLLLMNFSGIAPRVLVQEGYSAWVNKFGSQLENLEYQAIIPSIRTCAL